MNAAAFFDMDGVLLRGESQFSFLVWCLRRGVAPRVRALPVIMRYAAYLAGFSGDALKLRESGFALLRDVRVEKLERSALQFLEENQMPRVRRQAAPLIKSHRTQGNLVVLLTSACEPLALAVAGQFGFDAVISTRLLTRSGFYTGRRDLPEPYGAGKQLLVKQFCENRSISPADCFAYADHHTDAPLLEFVGHPVAANPTPKLESLAKAKQWPIVDLDSPAMQFVDAPKIDRSC